MYRLIVLLALAACQPPPPAPIVVPDTQRPGYAKPYEPYIVMPPNGLPGEVNAHVLRQGETAVCE